jgi:hypothetical protein
MAWFTAKIHPWPNRLSIVARIQILVYVPMYRGLGLGCQLIIWDVAVSSWLCNLHDFLASHNREVS